MGGPAPIDDTATSTSTPAGDGEAPSNPSTANLKPVDTPSTNATSTIAAPADGHAVVVSTGDHELARHADYGENSTKSNDLQSTGTTTTDAKVQLVNGDSGEHSASEDVSLQQALGEASGGSDTDISRPGSVDQAKDRATGHLRSNSVKKPASFKSVSVTKNFLAKSAVSTPSPRPGEKAAPTGQISASALQTQKPRLVAKSGSGIGNVTRSSLSKLNGAGAGPDASKVWNKNQPVPPPPPKQFTDEELKQQYGIHLATRLQADEAGKEAKWADIDDDEDDWAPDTVQWMDGTKSTVAAVENQPPPAEESKAGNKKEPTLEAGPPSPTPPTSSQRPGSTTGTKTILKPGAHAQASSTKSGLVLKGQPEKPTLVAKPSAAASVKSPWATLPPVEKVSPVQINPPVQQPSSRFSQRESHGYDAMPPPPPPAKEIAPDDFNRSWRGDRGDRELFNSHSGRYEPVNEMRRGSVRDNFRQQPSVLQRPSQDGPAEPSPAFQTSRTSADGPTWGRRRNSSNVSGGSGRRMSIDRRAPDLPPMPMNIQRRESHSMNGPDTLATGTPRLHHAVPDQHPSWTQSSPNLSNAQPVSPYGSVASGGPPDATTPSTTAPAENPVEVQNRLMREKLERARLQKQKEREEEEKEEAERKERLRKKLAAMGLADDSKSKSKEQSPSRSIEKSPQKDKAVPAPVQSPPKPPVPTSEGEVAQYGMMKVHQPHPVKKPYHLDSTASKTLKSGEPAPKPSPSPVKAQSEVQPKPGPSLTEIPPQATGTFTRDGNRNNKPSSEQSQTQAPQPEGDTRANNPALKPAQPPPQAAWSTSLPQQSRPWASNVWGPPQTKDRALGNGTFDSGYRGQPRPSPPQLSSQSQPTPAPPLGLNPPLKPSAPQPQVTPNQSFSQQAIYGQTETMSTQQSNATPQPGPIAPPADKGWGNFHATIRLDDQAMVVKARQDLERMGGETFRPEIRETYTDQQGRSQKTLHNKVGGNLALGKNGIPPEVTQTHAAEQKPKDETAKTMFASAPAVNEPSTTQNVIGQSAHLPSTGTAARSSRFFPRASESTVPASTASNKSDSPPPPPPETESHPAFIGDAHHPVVKMPKPSPRVRLPPTATETTAPSEAPPVSMPSRTRLGLGARPLALDPEWQARFNSLLEKPSPAPVPVPTSKTSASQPATHAKPGALAVAASSKAPLEVRGNITAATVSLPNAVARKMFLDDDSSEITTCASAEEVLLEDREFGSLPIVKPPKVSHLAANEPPVGFPPARPNSRFQRPLDVTTKPMYILDYDRNADGTDVKIWMRNMREVITKRISKKRDNTRKSPGHKGPRRDYTPTGGASSPSQSQRPRKSSGYQGGQGSKSNSSPRPSGGNGWGSNRSTPPQHNTNNTWARRAAPSAPVH